MEWSWLASRVAGALVLLYLVELICRVSLPSRCVPSVWLAWFGSQIFVHCAFLTYSGLDLCRRVFEYLLRLPLWRQMLESLGVFQRLFEFLLSPLGFLYGAIRYMTGRLAYWTGSIIPTEVTQAFSEISSVPDWIGSYCRRDLALYLLVPSAYCWLIFGLLVAAGWMYGKPVAEYFLTRLQQWKS